MTDNNNPTKGNNLHGKGSSGSEMGGTPHTGTPHTANTAIEAGIHTVEPMPELPGGDDPFAHMMEQMQAFNSIYDNAVDKISSSFDTLREEVEEKNRELASVHNLLETVIDNTTNAIYVIDSDGTELLSNSRSKMLIADLGKDAFQNLIREARHDDINVVEDGFRYFKVSYHPLDSSEYQGRVYVIDEITRLRNLEKESQRDQNLRMMGEMAANIAHDIRNPLGSIELFASLLGRDLSANHESQKLVKKIGVAVRTVDSIISNMLIFTRDLNISPKEHNVRTLVDEVVMYLVHMIRDKGINFTNTIDEDAVIVCDGELMKRVFMNIINNAVDAIDSDSGGNIRLSSTVNNNTLMLMFYDSGSGIPEDMLERLFMPFQTTKAKGTGLGLSIVYKLVQAHGFRINVDTDSQTYTEFIIEIPLKIG